jgi:hypothetical protein
MIEKARSQRRLCHTRALVAAARYAARRHVASTARFDHAPDEGDFPAFGLTVQPLLDNPALRAGARPCPEPRASIGCGFVTFRVSRVNARFTVMVSDA